MILVVVVAAIVRFPKKKKIQINYFDLGFAIYPLFLLHTHTRLHIIVIYLVVNNVCVWSINKFFFFISHFLLLVENGRNLLVRIWSIRSFILDSIQFIYRNEKKKKRIKIFIMKMISLTRAHTHTHKESVYVRFISIHLFFRWSVAWSGGFRSFSFSFSNKLFFCFIYLTLSLSHSFFLIRFI